MTDIKKEALEELEYIRLMLAPDPSDVKVTRDGGIATLCVGDTALRVDCYDAGDDDILIDDYFDAIRDRLQDALYEYALDFERVTDSQEHYWRYLLSTGGPGTEFRFFTNADLSLYKIEYWHLECGNTGYADVTSEDVAQDLWHCRLRDHAECMMEANNGRA